MAMRQILFLEQSSAILFAFSFHKFSVPHLNILLTSCCIGFLFLLVVFCVYRGFILWVPLRQHLNNMQTLISDGHFETALNPNLHLIIYYHS